MTRRCLHEISPGGIPPLARAFRASTSHSALRVKHFSIRIIRDIRMLEEAISLFVSIGRSPEAKPMGRLPLIPTVYDHRVDLPAPELP